MVVHIAHLDRNCNLLDYTFKINQPHDLKFIDYLMRNACKPAKFQVPGAGFSKTAAFRLSITSEKNLYLQEPAFKTMNVLVATCFNRISL